MDLPNIYEQFLSKKETLINQALKEAHFFEKRATGNVRPLVILKSDEHHKEWGKRINELKSLAEKLTNGDPVRFKPKAKIFNPAPTIFDSVYRIDVRESEAVSQKKIEKSSILRRMRNLLEDEKFNSITTGNYDKVHTITEQIKVMENDGEEFYLRRAAGYKDIRCLIYLTKNCTEPVKVNLSFAGLFVKPSPDAPENFISLPQQSRQTVERSDRLDLSGVTQVQHSLAMRGKIYRYSEYESLKRKAKTPPAN